MVWERSGKFIAPNGGVMRTSILGTMQFNDLTKVIDNTKNACQVTHADSRCIASCVAVTVAIALMLQGKYLKSNGQHDVDEIMREAHEYAQKELLEYKEHVSIYIFFFYLNTGCADIHCMYMYVQVYTESFVYHLFFITKT